MADAIILPLTDKYGDPLFRNCKGCGKSFSVYQVEDGERIGYGNEYCKTCEANGVSPVEFIR